MKRRKKITPGILLVVMVFAFLQGMAMVYIRGADRFEQINNTCGLYVALSPFSALPRGATIPRTRAGGSHNAGGGRSRGPPPAKAFPKD